MVINTKLYVYIAIATTIVTTTVIKDIETVCSSQLAQWGRFSSHRGYHTEGNLEDRV